MSVGSRVTSIVAILMLSTMASASMFNMQSSRNGLIFQMGFEEGSGTSTKDTAGRGHTGSFVSSYYPTWTSSGKNGNALSFSSSSHQRLVVSHSGTAKDNPQKFTWMAWVYPFSDPGAGEDTFLSNSHPSSYGTCNYVEAHDYSVCAGKPSVGMGDGTNWYVACGASKLTNNTWAHIAGTYDGAQLKMYVNGTLTNTVNVAVTMPTCAGPFKVGYDDGPGGAWGEFFNGRLDDVRYYGKALDATQINKLKDLRVP